MSEIAAILLFIMCAAIALIPIGLHVMAEYDKFLEIQADSENEK